MHEVWLSLVATMVALSKARPEEEEEEDEKKKQLESEPLNDKR